jgi:quinol monooxygenase YgiN
MEIGTESVETFAELSRALTEATRREPGCQGYTFAQSIEEPGRFEIFEEWVDDAALDEHTRAEHYKVWGRGLKDVEVRGVSIVRYAVSERTVLR